MLTFTNMRAAGYLPEFLSPYDTRPAREQINEHYVSGWHRFEGFTLIGVDSNCRLKYPGDPDMHEVSRAKLRDELIIVFQYDWVTIIQKDGTHEVARID